MPCVLCDKHSLKLIKKDKSLLSVTSDCKPFKNYTKLYFCPNCGLLQKKVNKKLKEIIYRVYKKYNLNHIANLKDHKIFSSSGPKTRSHLIFKFLKKEKILKAEGNILDYGCNKGQSLLAFKSFFPKWKLYGYDQIPILEKNKNITFFKTFNKIDKKFDFIYLSHTFEHFLNPKKDLKKVLQLANDNALLVIQVPYIRKNIFDLFVIDHITHHSKDTLKKVAMELGLKNISVSNSIIEHELTLVCNYKRGQKNKVARKLDRSKSNNLIKFYERKISKIENQLEQLHYRSKDKFIFGTGISSNWVAQQLKFDFNSFIDENLDKVGLKYRNKRIIHPSKLKEDQTVLIALPDPIKKLINFKFKNKYKANIKIIN